ncbi:hypothetical protein Tco_1106030 [Tanacetum coccineum]
MPDTLGWAMVAICGLFSTRLWNLVTYGPSELLDNVERDDSILTLTDNNHPIHTVLHLSKNEEKDDNLPYPKFRKFKQLAAQIINKHEEHEFPTAADDAESSTSYQPSPDAIMGPAWTLPPAWTESGVMLVLPVDPGLWLDVISRWESITMNRLNSQTWSNNKAKLAFVENLLGESKKLMWQQWRTAYPEAYSTLETIADDPQNITSQVRQLIIMEDPYRCSTDEQDRAYRDLDIITCEETKNLWKKYGIRKSRTYKGKPHNSHVNLIKRKYKDDRGRDIVSADFDDSSVYSISEGEGDVHQNINIMVQDTPLEEAAFMAIEGTNESDDEQSIEEDYYSHHAFMFHPRPPTKIAGMVRSVGSWKPDKELPTQSKSCVHDWKENTVTNYTVCYYCGILTTYMSRLNCPKCQLTTCALCARNYLRKTVNVKGKQPHKPEEEKDFYSNERKEELWQSEKCLLIKDVTDALKIIDQLKTEQINEEFSPLGISQIARPFMEVEVHYSGNITTTPKIRKVTNQLYNVKVEFEIPNFPMFGTTAIIDMGASTCCINKKQATYRIKQGSFLIEGNKFKIPLIYAFDMNDSNGIKMLIGANFLRSMKGGIRIEGDEITIYEKVTRIKTSNQTKIAEIAITELEVSEEEFMEINESIYFNQEGSKAFLEQFKPVIERLKHQGYIGEEPLKH